MCQISLLNSILAWYSFHLITFLKCFYLKYFSAVFVFTWFSIRSLLSPLPLYFCIQWDFFLCLFYGGFFSWSHTLGNGIRMCLEIVFFMFLVHLEHIIFIKLGKMRGIYLSKFFSVYIFSLPLHADTNHGLITHPPDHLKWSHIFMMLFFMFLFFFTFHISFLIAFIAPPLSSWIFSCAISDQLFT